MSDRMDWIGREPCGCVVVIMSAERGDQAEQFTELAKWAREGLTVDKVPVTEAVALFTTKCPHKLHQLGLLDEVQDDR